MQANALTPGVFAPAPQRDSFAAMVAAQGKIEAKLMLRHGEQLLVNVIIPATILLAAHFAPILGDNTTFDVLVPMVFAVAATGAGFTGQAIAVAFDRRYGALKRTGASGVPAWTIIAGKILGVLATVLVQIVVLSAIAFALAFLFEGEADLMIAARRGSPLAIGHGDGEMFLGSDAVALAPFTDRITYLEDGDHAVIRRQGAEIFDAAGQRANRDLQQIDVGATQIDKGGFRHFMAKEIAEQPVVLGDALNHYVKGDRIVLPEALDFSAVDRLTLVGCGTAYYAAHVARYWFETLAGLPCDLDVASEFRYREPPLSPQSWALFVSQSGETADTLAALHYARDKVARTVGVVNVGTSAIARDADIALPTLAGIEVGVASSKAFTCQLAVLAVLALKAAQDRGRLDAAGLAAHLADLRALPGLLNQALAVSDECRRLAGWLSEAQDVLYLGRGPLYPVALEGALKLKELSYIHAEGYASGELKHGPIALIDRNVPVVVLAPRDGLFDKTVSNMQEVMARHGQVLLISDAEGVEKGGQGVHDSLTMPTGGGVFQPILYAVPMQYLAYHTAVAKGTDVDQPRNLAKSVTVE